MVTVHFLTKEPLETASLNKFLSLHFTGLTPGSLCGNRHLLHLSLTELSPNFLSQTAPILDFPGCIYQCVLCSECMPEYDALSQSIWSLVFQLLIALWTLNNFFHPSAKHWFIPLLWAIYSLLIRHNLIILLLKQTKRIYKATFKWNHISACRDIKNEIMQFILPVSNKGKIGCIVF